MSPTVIGLPAGHFSKISIVSDAPQGISWNRAPPSASYGRSNAFAIVFGGDI